MYTRTTASAPTRGRAESLQTTSQRHGVHGGHVTTGQCHLQTHAGHTNGVVQGLQAPKPLLKLSAHQQSLCRLNQPTQTSPASMLLRHCSAHSLPLTAIVGWLNKSPRRLQQQAALQPSNTAAFAAADLNRQVHTGLASLATPLPASSKLPWCLFSGTPCRPAAATCDRKQPTATKGMHMYLMPAWPQGEWVAAMLPCRHAAMLPCCSNSCWSGAPSAARPGAFAASCGAPSSTHVSLGKHARACAQRSHKMVMVAHSPTTHAATPTTIYTRMLPTPQH
jgi:hypothetical protein